MREIPRDFEITTERLTLKIPIESELCVLFEATKVPGFNDGMVWDPPGSIDEMIPFFKKLPEDWKKGTSYTFSFYIRESGTFAGRIGIRQREEIGPDRWNLGFFTLPEHQGKGYVSEAIRAILQFGFEELNASTIDACHALWNEASKRALTKNGLKFLEHIPQGFKKKGEWVAEDLLGITREEWKGGAPERA